jgi:beta-lactamase class D
MSAPENKWYGRGLIVDAEDQVTEMKRLERPELTFSTKKKAEEHALKLCKQWIDEQKSVSESTSLTPSAPAL